MDDICICLWLGLMDITKRYRVDSVQKYHLTRIWNPIVGVRPSHHRLISIRNRKWQDYVYIQCEYKSTKQKIKHLLREENKVKENKIS